MGRYRGGSHQISYIDIIWEITDIAGMIWDISGICRGIPYCRLFPISVADKIRKLVAAMVVAMVAAMGWLWLLLWLLLWDGYGCCYGCCHGMAMRWR